MAGKKAKKTSKTLGKKSMKKTKGGLLPASPTGRYAGKYSTPTEPIAPIDPGSINPCF